MASDSDIQALLGNIPTNREYLPQLVDQFGKSSGILPFVGAGMSRPFGFPLWSEFLIELATEAETTVKTRAQLDSLKYEEAATDLLEALGQRRFQDVLARRYGDQVLDGRRIEGAILELSKLPPGPVITTNFDRLLERAFAQSGRTLKPFSSAAATKGSEALQQNRLFLLKLHGDWEDPQTRILTLSEYEAAYGNATPNKVNLALPLPILLFLLLASRCCLFIGCSLRQDRTARVLRSIAQEHPDLVHYAIVEMPAASEEFHRRAAELSTQSIRPIWFPPDRYDLIQPLLSYLAIAAVARLRRLADSAASSTTARNEPPNNIPDLGNVTVGRDVEIRQVRDMLRVARVITITGASGCGKSRLAVEVASATKAEYTAGTWFIPLADLSKKADKELVLPSRIGKIVGVPEQAGRPPNESLAEHLTSGRFLLVLDNCEHVIESCRQLVSYLLPRCPDLTILTTSRLRLNRSGDDQPIPQERLFPLAPLRVPEPGITAFNEIVRIESVMLFVERARQRFPSWQLEATCAEAVADICRALDGIPLAIEVAAARLGVISLEEMRAQSRDLLSAIGGIHTGELRRWKTLTAAIRWSYGLLHPKQQLFMRSMAVFDGGWTKQAAQAVYGGGDADVESVLNYLQELDDNSLVSVTDVNDSKRFRYLEPIRQFVQVQLKPEERIECERAHTEFFLGLAERAAPELLKGSQAQWLDALQQEADNFRAAIRWCVNHSNAEWGLRLIAALWRFVEIRGYLKEGRDRAEDVLKIDGVQRFPAHLSKVLSGAGMLAYRQADFEAARVKFEHSLEIETELGNDAGRANALNDLGNVAIMQGDFTRARDLYRQSLAIEVSNNNMRAVAVAKFNLGAVALAIGDYPEAERLMTESLKGFREGANDRESAFPLNGLGEIATATGRLDLAEEYAETSHKLRQKVKDTKGIADTLRTLGWASIEAGDYQKARERLSESINLARGVGDKRGVAEALELFGLLFARSDRGMRSVEVIAAANQIRQGFHYALSPVRIDRRESALALTRESVGQQEYERAWRRGASWSLSDAVDNAVNQDAARSEGR